MKKLKIYVKSCGRILTSAAGRAAGWTSGIFMSRIRSVITIAKTPSENASRRALFKGMTSAFV
jgi:hypothetical protein